MSFSASEVSVDIASSSHAKNTKAVVEALVDLCPNLTMETVVEDTDTKYSAIMRVCETDLAIKAEFNAGTSMTFIVGKYVGDNLIQKFNFAPSSYIFLNPQDAVKINMHTVNGAAYFITIDALSYTMGARFGVGRLTSQHDGQARPFCLHDFRSNSGNGVALTDSNAVEVMRQPSETVSGHLGAGAASSTPMLIMAPWYFDCYQQFLGLPTIGGGETYWTSQTFAPYNQYTINGKKYYFLSSNICVDVD